LILDFHAYYYHKLITRMNRASTNYYTMTNRRHD